MTRTEFIAIVARAQALVAQRQRARLGVLSDAKGIVLSDAKGGVLSDAKGGVLSDATAPAWLADLLVLAKEQDDHGPL